MNRHTFASNETGAMSDLTAELRDRRFGVPAFVNAVLTIGWDGPWGMEHMFGGYRWARPSPGPETRHCTASILQCNVELRSPPAPETGIATVVGDERCTATISLTA